MYKAILLKFKKTLKFDGGSEKYSKLWLKMLVKKLIFQESKNLLTFQPNFINFNWLIESKINKKGKLKLIDFYRMVNKSFSMIQRCNQLIFEFSFSCEIFILIFIFNPCLVDILDLINNLISSSRISLFLFECSNWDLKKKCFYCF